MSGSRRCLTGIVTSVEQELGSKETEGRPLERIRRARVRLVRRLAEVSADAAQSEPRAAPWICLLLAENLNAHSMAYLESRPSLERLIETVMRIEETLDDSDVPIGPQRRRGDDWPGH